jgi:hypothetical protein
MGIKRTVKRLFQTPLFKNNLWRIQMDGVNPDLMLLAQNVTFPENDLTLDYDEVRQKHYVSKVENPKTLSIGFIETEDLRISQMLDFFDETTVISSNKNRSGVLTSGIGGAEFSKRTVVVTLERFKPLVGQLGDRVIEFLSVGGVGASSVFETDFLEPVAEFTFRGCLLQNRSALSLDYDDNPLTIIEANFTIDGMDKKYFNLPGKGILGI